MNKLLLTSFFSVVFWMLTAQSWQQRVDYRISVTLDDVTHRLYGDIAFDYVNNAPTSLDSLYIHVWPNAYQPTKSALANQLANGGKNLSIIDTAKWGGISALAFNINGVPVTWDFDPSHRDIVQIKLPQPLESGKKLTVTTPFVVKIPYGSISRLGHIGQSYQITQWYPKPAVYDHKGWHPIPYLNQGEFYSEFGSFDVSIKLPKNYVLSATGELQTPSEQIFMNELADQTLANMEQILALPAGNERDSFPPSSNEWKTVRFTQDNVHDFAWFADKRYKVLKGKVKLPHSGKEVTTWALFTPANASLWKDAIAYINDGTYYYSKWNGDYPYAAVTAVDGTISAGGGMEYPMITVIGNASSPLELEIVIVHEVGHNWFYGILGSNERQHGWMDEGMNTANEMRYVATKYPKNQQMSDMVLGGKLHLNDLDHHDMGDISCRALAMIGADQPIETHSADFSSTNYGMIMYQKTGLIFQYLRSYLGDDLYDQCMQRYYDLFKFKHPYPEDMKRVLEAVSARNLDWLFKDLIQTTRTLDYKIAKVKWIKAVNVYNVKVKNRSSILGPIGVSSLASDGRIIETQWSNPKDRKSTLFFNGDKSIVSFSIDPDRNIPEINRTNNLYRVDRSIARKCEPLSFEFGFGDNEWGRNNVFWLPMMAFNHSDKAMLGVAFHNYGLPFNPIQYFIAPMYSFGRNRPGGIAEIGRTFFPGKFPGPVKVGVSIKSFGIDDDPKSEEQSYFVAATPYVKVNLQSSRRKKGVLHDLTLKGLVRQDAFLNENSREWGGKLTYTYGRVTRAFDHQTILQAEGILGKSNLVQDLSGFNRVSLTQEFRWQYLDRAITRSIQLRLYGGMNLSYNPGSSYFNSMGRYSISMFGAAGYQDIFAEHYFFNRATVSGSQYANNMGGFRTASDLLRMSNYWASSANLTVQLPFNPNLFVAYGDFGLYDDGIRTSALYTAGLGINLGGIFGVYFPLVQSTNMEDLYSQYKNSIRLTMNFNPFQLPMSIKQILNK